MQIQTGQRDGIGKVGNKKAYSLSRQSSSPNIPHHQFSTKQTENTKQTQHTYKYNTFPEHKYKHKRNTNTTNIIEIQTQNIHITTKQIRNISRKKYKAK